jgi:hypothetical protein
VRESEVARLVGCEIAIRPAQLKPTRPCLVSKVAAGSWPVTPRQRR